MSYIHFKSVFNKNYDNITFDGPSLSVAELKKLIIAKSKFTKQLDFDLEITNADSNEGKLSYHDCSALFNFNSDCFVNKKIGKFTAMKMK
jgi:hypothetical protein